MGDLIQFPLDRVNRRLKCRYCDWSCPLYEHSKAKPQTGYFGENVFGWEGLHSHIEGEHHFEHEEVVGQLEKTDGGSAIFPDVLGFDP